MEKVRDVICKNFKRLVDSSELTPKAIAQKAKVSEPTIYRWMNGENTPELSNIENVAKVLDVDPFEFYRTDSPRPLPKSFKIKAISNYLEAIPDDIYEKAQGVALDDDAWDTVRSALKVAKEIQQAKKKNEA